MAQLRFHRLGCRCSRLREPRRRLLEGERLQHRVLVVEHDHGRGLADAFDPHRLLPPVDHRPRHDVARRGPDPDRERRAEDGGVL